VLVVDVLESSSEAKLLTCSSSDVGEGCSYWRGAVHKLDAAVENLLRIRCRPVFSDPNGSDSRGAQ
jgi:hypothetical protein